MSLYSFSGEMHNSFDCSLPILWVYVSLNSILIQLSSQWMETSIILAQSSIKQYVRIQHTRRTMYHLYHHAMYGGIDDKVLGSGPDGYFPCIHTMSRYWLRHCFTQLVSKNKKAYSTRSEVDSLPNKLRIRSFYCMKFSCWVTNIQDFFFKKKPTTCIDSYVVLHFDTNIILSGNDILLQIKDHRMKDTCLPFFLKKENW